MRKLTASRQPVRPKRLKPLVALFHTGTLNGLLLRMEESGDHVSRELHVLHKVMSSLYSSPESSTEALSSLAAGRMAPEHGVKGGLMAAVGLSAEAADARLKKEGLQGIVVGCDNSPSNVTLAGKPFSAC